MRQSKLFTKTQKTVSAGETSKNAQLLTRGGFIYKNSAGIYTYLPLGWRVIEKLSNIIREEMNAIGSVEMFMPALVSKEYLQATDRWDKGVGFKVVSQTDLDKLQAPIRQLADKLQEEYVLGWTHEEVITVIASNYVNSYRDLPFFTYQIQTKFRDEKRAKSGLLRGREFGMKDLYSFHTNEADLEAYYKLAHDAYIKIFKRLGLEAFSVEASGGAISKKFSHEFMVKNIAGEDLTILCEKCAWAQNKEIAKVKAGDKCPTCGAKLTEEKTVEAGNIFKLGNEYSSKMSLKYTDQDGKQKDIIMGCYGIGLGRAMGTIVEANHDKDGIIWPKNTTPFHVHLLNLAKNDNTKAEAIYKNLQKKGFEVLYDDRGISFGKKLKDADLIGIPYQLIISEKNKDLELVSRADHKKQMFDLNKVIEVVENFYR